MPLKFNPPKQAARYALFSYGEVPNQGEFKVYNDLGAVKNAAHRKLRWSNIVILENVDGDWYQLYKAEKGTSYKELPWVKLKSSLRWSDSYKATPMTRDEYAEWRIAVERERIADGSASLDLNPGREFLSPDQYSTN
jgi:hypothetical protein